MPRVYKPRSKFTQYEPDVLKEAIASVKNGTLSINKASEQYGIKRTTLQNRVKDIHNKKQGGPCAMNEDDEMRLKNMLLTVSHWGFPLSKLDLRHVTKAYLDKCDKNIPRFKNNFPGDDWAESFLSRHGLRTKKSQNIAPARAGVTVEMMTKYFENLEDTIKNVPPENIFNYDETNFTDDPGSRKLIFRRGVKYPENIMAHSKTSTSVMFCGSATGEILPIYVVYKAENVYDTWIKDGPPGARYNATSHGWFEGSTFFDWFRTIFVHHARKLSGTKVIIGDNLSTHFSEEVIKLAQAENILFICLPPNCTHIAQPLDVAFFAPLKRLWRQILTEYKLKHPKEKVVPKESFTSLMTSLWDGLLKGKGSENLISGFQACGIVPFDKNEVIKKIDKTTTPGVDAGYALNDTVLTYLKNLREPEPSKRGGKKRKVTTEPGLSVSLDDFVQNEPKKPKKKICRRRILRAPTRITCKSRSRKRLCPSSKNKSNTPKKKIILKKVQSKDLNEAVNFGVSTRSSTRKLKPPAKLSS